MRYNKYKAGGCMTMTSGLVLIGVYSSRIMSYNHSKRMIKKKPYELQYVPVFSLCFVCLVHYKI